MRRAARLAAHVLGGEPARAWRHADWVGAVATDAAAGRADAAPWQPAAAEAEVPAEMSERVSQPSLA
jgi:hypothetical protein